MSATQRYEAARAAMLKAEAEGRSAATIAKKWRELFKAEDAMKLASGGWHR